MEEDKLERALDVSCFRLTGSGKSIDILVALKSHPDEFILRKLADLGFKLRSSVGNKLTGSIMSENINLLKAYPEVLDVEFSMPVKKKRFLF